MKQTLGSLDYWVGLDCRHWWRWGWTRGFSKDLYIKAILPPQFSSTSYAGCPIARSLAPSSKEKQSFLKKSKELSGENYSHLRGTGDSSETSSFGMAFSQPVCPLQSKACPGDNSHLCTHYSQSVIQFPHFSPNINRHPKIIRHLSQIYKMEEKEEGNNEKKCS